jgi:SET domain-containing protein
MALDNRVHTVNRGAGLREFFGFDTFQNHSCEPNTAMRYLSATHYELVAAEAIAAGVELTCDYETFDTLYLDDSSFECKCCKPSCRGVVRA